MVDRKSVCSQQVHCLSCPLSKALTGKDCRELTHNEMQNIISLFRELEKLPETVIIESLEEYLRGEKSMYIAGQWFEESEANALFKDMQSRIKELEEENNQLREVIARSSEEEYE